MPISELINLPVDVSVLNGHFSFAQGKVLTVNNNIGLSGTDGKTLTVNQNLLLNGNNNKQLVLNGSLFVGADTNLNGGGTININGFTLTLTGSGSPLLDTGSITTTPPLQGGGFISDNLILSIDPATITDPGSMSAADKAKLDQFITVGGKSYTFNKTVTLDGTDGSTLTLNGSLTIDANTTINGGGTINVNTFTFTIPATGTAVLTTRTLSAGNGILGGGDLSLDRSFAVDYATSAPPLVSLTASAIGASLKVAREDHGHQLDQSIIPTWTGAHAFQATMTTRLLQPESSSAYDVGTNARFYRTLYSDNIAATVFIEETVQLFGGWLMVPKGAGTFPAATGTGTAIDFGKVVSAGEVALVRGKDSGAAYHTEYILIVSRASGTTYNVTRDFSGGGAAYDWPADTPYAILGGIGDGRIELESYDTPRISIFKITSLTPGAYSEVEYLRGGDINGMPGVASPTPGLYIGSASQYMKYDAGTGVLTIAGNGSGLTSISGGNITTGSITATQIASHTITAAVIAAGTITATEIASHTITAAVIAAGTITATEIATGTITGTQMSLTTKLSINSSTYGADGIQLDYNAGNPRAYIGDGANQYFQFDGTKITWKAANTTLDASGNLSASNATLSGSITSSSGTIAGWTINASSIADNNNLLILDSVAPSVQFKSGTTLVTYLASTGLSVRVQAGTLATQTALVQFYETLPSTNLRSRLLVVNDPTWDGIITMTETRPVTGHNGAITVRVCKPGGTPATDYAELWQEYNNAAGTYSFSIGSSSIVPLQGGFDAVNLNSDVIITGQTFIYPGSTPTLPASTERIDVNVNMARTETFTQGNITTQRAIVFQPPTYAFTGAVNSTITTAATVAITNAPAAGAHAVLTNAYALWVQAGLVKFDGNFGVAGTTVLSSGLTGTTINISGQFTSTLAIGTAPMVITSTTKVANLNVDYLDGLSSATSGANAHIVATDSSGNTSITQLTLTAAGATPPFVVSSTTKVTNLNADALNGLTWASSGATQHVLATDPAGSVALVDLNLSNDLKFTSTGQRITGDMSNATHASRVLFQTSTVGGQTNIGLIPNAASAATSFFTYNSNDPDNAGFVQFYCTATIAALSSNAKGTGTVNPLLIQLSGTEVARFPVTVSTTAGVLRFTLANAGGSLAAWGVVSSLAVGSAVAAASLAKLPGSTAGKANDGWIRIDVNGATAVIPYWTI